MYYHTIIFMDDQALVSINVWSDPEILAEHVQFLQDSFPNNEYCIGIEVE